MRKTPNVLVLIGPRNREPEGREGKDGIAVFIDVKSCCTRLEKICYVFIMDTKRINSGYKGKIWFGHEENQISYIRFCSVFIDVKALMFILVPVSSVCLQITELC